MKNETKNWIYANCGFVKIAMPLPKSIPQDNSRKIDISTLDDNKIKNDYGQIFKDISPGMIKNISDRIPVDVAKEIEIKYPNLSFLAHGSYGVVYEIPNDPGWLVKVTTDESEWKSLKRIDQGGFEHQKCFVKCKSFDRIEIKDTRYRNKHIGIIVTKKLDLLDDIEKYWVGIISSYLREIGHDIKKYDFDGFKKYLKLNQDIFGKDILKKLQIEGLDIITKYMNLKKCLRSNKYNDLDLTVYNIGKENDQYYMIDFGHLV